jgi:hypothetical protein
MKIQAELQNYGITSRITRMIGYARSGYTIRPKLSDALQARSKAIPTIVAVQPCRHSKGDSPSEKVHVSKHERTFIYVGSEKAAPAIVIRHLWLKRD